MSRQVISRLANRQTGPLSFQQEGLWFLSQLDPTSPRYNVARGLRLRGALVREALQGAVNEIVRRHETLRSRFIDAGGKPMQTLERNVTVPVTFVDLANEPDREARLRSVCAEQIGRPFDLSRDAMLRASLIRVTERDHTLVFVMPHITCDGWSLNNLVREFLTAAERSIAAIWAEVLQVERVAVYDNFFELGGHSLLAVQVVSRLQQAFEVELPLRALFDQQTVSELAETISMIRENTSVAEVNETTLRIEFPSEEKASADEAGKTNI